MTFSLIGRSAVYIGSFFLVWSSFVFSPKAAHSDFSTSSQKITVSRYHADSLHLTQDKVKDWIETRISVAKLQNKMKNNAGDYDNVVQAFYTKRESLLKSRGWTVKEFDTSKDRIHAAISAMDMEDELEESREDYEEEIAEIEANKFYSENQKEEMIKALSSMREQKRKLYVEPTKSDWPAVGPYRLVFQQMTQWIAGNTPEPPIIH